MRQCSFPNLAPTSNTEVNTCCIQQTAKTYKCIKITRDIYLENKSVRFRHFDAYFDATFCRSCCIDFLLGIMKPCFYI